MAHVKTTKIRAIHFLAISNEAREKIVENVIKMDINW